MLGNHALDTARAVFEGWHGYWYELDTHVFAASTLAKLMNSQDFGRAVMVTGPPGCGVTSLLDQVKQEYEGSVVEVQARFYDNKVTLIDRISDVVNMRELHEFNKVVPSYLVAYACLTGRRTIVVDDIDQLVLLDADIDLIFESISNLTKADPPFNTILSTRNAQMLRRFEEKAFPHKTVISLMATLRLNEFMEIAEGFWGHCNTRYHIDIPVPQNLTKVFAETDGQLDTVIDALQIWYAYYIFSAEGALMPYKEITLNEARSNVLRTAYS